MATAAVLPGGPVRAGLGLRRLPVPLTLGLCLVLLLTAGGAVLARVGPQDADIPLASGTVALAADGQVVEVAPGTGRVVPGTRVLAGPGSATAVADERAWLAAGTVPSVP